MDLKRQNAIRVTLYGSVVVSLVGWFCLLMYADIATDFPLNDDWVHALSVRALVNEGKFLLIDYCGSTIFAQVLWGALFCSFGFSFTALRLSVLILGMVGVLTCYWLAKRYGANELGAVALSLLLLASPIYFSLSGTFMTDVPFTTTILIAIYFYSLAMKHQRLYQFVLAGVFVLVATFIRQLGVVLPFVFVLTSYFNNGLRSRQTGYAIGIFGVVLVSLLLYLEYLSSVEMLPSSFSGGEVVLNNVISGAIFRRGLAVALHGFLNIGLFGFPLLLMLIERELIVRNKWLIKVYLLIFVLLLGLIHYDFITFPLGNILNNFHIGPQTFYTTVDNPLVTPVSNGALIFRLVLGVVAISGAGIYLVLFVDGYKGMTMNMLKAEYQLQLFVFSFIVIYLVFIVTANTLFDRYFLPVLPLAILLVLPNSKLSVSRLKAFVSAVCFLILLAYSTFGYKTYIAANKARWQAVDFLNSMGIESVKINGGYEFNGWMNYTDELHSNGGNEDWWSVDPQYFITNQPVSSEYMLIKEFEYYNWLTFEEESLLVLQLR